MANFVIECSSNNRAQDVKKLRLLNDGYVLSEADENGVLDLECLRSRVGDDITLRFPDGGESRCKIGIDIHEDNKIIVN